MKTESDILHFAREYAKEKKENRLFGQRVSRCISTEEYQSDAFLDGYKTCQQEYEEKLRWIPIEEKKTPP